MNIKLSLIIPVYGVAMFAERCARSLMSQTLRDGVEFIFVDDCTPDDSIAIIERVVAEYPERKGQVTILHHKENKGLPAARNTGLATAKGKYIYHFDGDDFAEPKLLEQMLRTAEENDADYVWADWFLTYEHSDRKMSQPTFSTPEDALRGMLTGRMKYNVWNKIVKRNLYTDNNIWFPAGYGMGEDMTMIRLLACAKTVAHCPYAGYHYVRTNSEAMTSNVNDKSYTEITHNVAITISFLKNKIKSDIAPVASAFCLHTKFPLLISSDKNDYLRWKTLWPESNAYIDCAGFSTRNRILNNIAKRKWWGFVRLHSKIYHWIYTLIFN